LYWDCCCSGGPPPSLLMSSLPLHCPRLSTVAHEVRLHNGHAVARPSAIALCTS
jgi:hypothetical protein